MENALETIGNLGLIPVVSVSKVEDALKLGQALIAGNLPCVEITFRTEAAEEAINGLVCRYPEMVVGAGTVLRVSQAEKAINAGARFIISPGFDQKVVSWCLDHGTVVVPGVATPSEINMAIQQGLQILKLFPAGALGGPKYIKAISAPYGGVKFIPTGGVNTDNLAEYLRLPSVHCCGGSWLAKQQMIAEGKFDEITEVVREALDVVKRVRSKER